MLNIRAIMAGGLLLAATIPLSPAWADASATTPKAALERLFDQPIERQWFAPAFLGSMPAGDIAATVSRLTSSYGKLQDIAGSGNDLVVGLARANIPAHVTLDDQGRISALTFEQAIANNSTLRDFLASTTAAPGKIATG